MAQAGATSGGATEQPALRSPAAPLLWERATVAAVLLAFVAVFLALAVPLFRRHVIPRDDLGDYHLPCRWFYSRCLASGDSFAWCPGLFCGFYLHGEGQGGFCHPLHLLLYGTLPLDVAFNLEILLCYPALFLGTYLWLRRWELPRAPALFGGLLFAFSGFNLLHYVHVNALAIIAHLPWELLAIHVVLRGRDRRHVALALLGLGLLIASQVLLGYPQYLWFNSLTSLLYTLLLLRPWPGWRRLLLVATVPGVGVLSGAVQLLPTAEVLRDSVRDLPQGEFLAEGSTHPANLIQFVAPYLLGPRVVPHNGATTMGFVTHEFVLYDGAVTLALVVWALLRWKHLGPWRRPVKAALALAAVMLVLAFGSHTPLYALHARLPIVGLFRCPCRYALLLHLALAAVGAMAFADLSRPAEISSRPRLWPLALLPLAAAAVALGARAWVRLGLPGAGYLPLASEGAALLGVLLMAAAAGLVFAAARGARWALPALVVFAAADLASYGLTYLYHAGATDIPAFVASIPAPPTARPARVHSASNPLLMQGHSLTLGYVGLEPRRRLRYRTTACLRVAGAAYRTQEGGWVPVANPLPRARLVARAQVSTDPAGDLETIDPATTVLVEGPVSLPDGEPGTALLVEDRPGDLRVRTVAAGRRFLVVSESWHAGWEATVDGEPVPVLRAYGDFLGCVAPEGEHEVAFHFRPQSLHLGLWLSALGLGLLLALCAVSFLLIRDGPHSPPIGLKHAADPRATDNA